jgi:hypothetical protein
MKKLTIDFNEIQKAMEDVSRDAYEYFFDIQCGEVIILSVDILMRAQEMLEESYDDDMVNYEEVEFDEVVEIPPWMEEEIELAMDILLHDCSRFVRIPERSSHHGFNVMREFTESVKNPDLREKLSNIIDGKGAFRRFKDALEPYSKERKQWYGYNAVANRKVIEKWLKTLGIEPRMDS